MSVVVDMANDNNKYHNKVTSCMGSYACILDKILPKTFFYELFHYTKTW